MKRKIESEALVAKVYPLLEDVVERGVRFGYNRAGKHVENPGEENYVEAISESVVNEILEAFEIK